MDGTGGKPLICFRELSALYGETPAEEVDVLGETEVAVAVVIVLELIAVDMDLAYRSSRL